MTDAPSAIPAGWVQAGESSHPKNKVGRWRQEGRLVEGADWVSVKPENPGYNIRRPTYYFDPKALDREAERERAELGDTRSEQQVRRWAKSERITEGKETLLREKVAWKFLGVSQRQFWLWSDPDGDGCPDLGGKVLGIADGKIIERKTSNGTMARYWPMSELEQVKEARKDRPREIPDEVLSFEETVDSLPGIPAKTLRDAERRRRFGLEAARCRVTVTNHKERDFEQAGTVVGFTRASVQAALRDFPPPSIPRHLETLAEAAKRIDVSGPTVRRLHAAGLLRGEVRDAFPVGRHGISSGLLIDRTDAMRAARIVRRLRRQGGYHVAAELRKQLQMPLAVAPAKADQEVAAAKAVDPGPAHAGTTPGREYQSSSEWAAELGLHPKAVETKLRRLRIRGKIRALKNTDRRMNEPEYVYPRADVVRYLKVPADADAR